MSEPTSTASSQRRVIVIGAGLSGLATAVQIHLRDSSLQVTVLEAASRAGGVITTEKTDRFLIDHGADMFAASPPHAVDLCKRLGIDDRLILPEPSRRGARIFFRGKLVPVPDGFVVMRATKCLPMLRTPLLDWKGKLRFLWERFVPRRRGTETDDESVESFAKRRMGSQVADRLVAPLAAGIYTADVSRLSMKATMGKFAEMEQQYGSLAQAARQRRRSGEDAVERISTGARYGQFRALKGGMRELIESLHDFLPAESVQFNRPATAIRRDGDHWNVETDKGTLSCERLIVATPPKPAAKLLQPVTPEAADELAAIESASTAIVVLAVRRVDIAKDIETFGFVVPPKENRRILAGSFASHKFAGRAPDDSVLIRVFVGGVLQADLLEQDDDSLVKLVRQELAEIIGLSGEPELTRVVRWHDAMPQYNIGHSARVKQIEAALGNVAGLWLATNALYGVGIAPVIGQAARVADQVVASFTNSGDTPSGDRVGSGGAFQR